MGNELSFSNRLDELNDFIQTKIDELFPEATIAPLWLGSYNEGSGDRITLPDGSSFCLTIAHIVDYEEELIDED